MERDLRTGLNECEQMDASVGLNNRKIKDDEIEDEQF